MSTQWNCETSISAVLKSSVVSDDPSPRQPASVRARRREADGSQVVRELRVLVVDHDQNRSALLIRRLRRWGLNVRTAHDGRSSLRAAAAQHPDVVVLDTDMPFMDGCAIAKQLRRDFPRRECFIIAVAEQSDDEHGEQRREAGIDLLLVNPIDPSTLETLLLECELVSRRHSSPVHNRQQRCDETVRASC